MRLHLVVLSVAASSFGWAFVPCRRDHSHYTILSSAEGEGPDDTLLRLQQRASELGLDSESVRREAENRAVSEETQVLDRAELRRRYYESFFRARQLRGIQNAFASSNMTVLAAAAMAAEGMDVVPASSLASEAQPQAPVQPIVSSGLPALAVNQLATFFGLPNEEEARTQLFEWARNSEIKHARTSMLALFFFASKQLFCQCAQHAQYGLDFASSSVLAGAHAGSTSPLDASTAWLGTLTLGAVVLAELAVLRQDEPEDGVAGEAHSSWGAWGIQRSPEFMLARDAFSSLSEELYETRVLPFFRRLEASELEHGRVAMIGAATLLFQSAPTVLVPAVAVAQTSI